MNADPGVYLTQHQYIEDPQTIVKLMTQKNKWGWKESRFSI